MCGPATARSRGTLRNFISCQVIAIIAMAIITNLITYQWDVDWSHVQSDTWLCCPNGDGNGLQLKYFWTATRALQCCSSSAVGCSKRQQFKFLFWRRMFVLLQHVNGLCLWNAKITFNFKSSYWPRFKIMVSDWMISKTQRLFPYSGVISSRSRGEIDQLWKSRNIIINIYIFTTFNRLVAQYTNV